MVSVKPHRVKSTVYSLPCRYLYLINLRGLSLYSIHCVYLYLSIFYLPCLSVSVYFLFTVAIHMYLLSLYSIHCSYLYLSIFYSLSVSVNSIFFSQWLFESVILIGLSLHSIHYGYLYLLNFIGVSLFSILYLLSLYSFPCGIICVCLPSFSWNVVLKTLLAETTSSRTVSDMDLSTYFDSKPPPTHLPSLPPPPPSLSRGPGLAGYLPPA